ncbi:MAG: hypothetical protein H6740_19440 [Alphaproteobacteria bacterium]|nr:hypothetical protein [Alphaproteobacteria bacterium]
MVSCISSPRAALAAALLGLAWPGAALAGWRCLTQEGLEGVALPGPTFQPRPVGPPATDTCWGQQAAYRVEGEHVAVEYDDDGLRSEALVLRRALDDAYEALIGDLGWPEIEGADRYLMLAYIDSAAGGGAYTTMGVCADGSPMPYMVTFSDVFDDETWVEDMAVHELNHFHHFTMGVGHESWWWEATATWNQEAANPRHDTWLSYVDQGFLAQPQLAMRASSQSDAADFAHMYGMALFAAHLAERVDGPDLVRRTWTEASAAVRPLPTLLEDMGYNFDGVYRGFVVSAATKRWADASGLGELAVAETVSRLPAQGTIADGRAPENLGQAFLRVEVPEWTEEAPDLGLSFTGDPAGQWRVFLIGVAGGEPAEVVEIEISEGEGAGQLPGMAGYSHAWVVATPTSMASRRAFGFAYLLDAVEASPEDSLAPDPGGGDSGLSEPRPESEVGGRPLETPSGRCQVGGAGPWLLGLLMLWRRRLSR